MSEFRVFPLCPILIWLILVGFFTSVCFAVQDGIKRLKKLHQIPCSKCAFFTNDYRLKCTVYPCKALSEEALGCLDYEPASVLAINRVVKTGSRQRIWKNKKRVNWLQIR